jgi:hypothetical protein
MACSGFKLDTLLKLADVKGVDRKTSLLHFVLDQLLKDSATLPTLSTQLDNVRPAANLQVVHLPSAAFPPFHLLKYKNNWLIEWPDQANLLM